MGLCADLALVDARIPGLGIFDLQRPLICSPFVDGLESLITSVRVSGHCQDVDISMSNP